jgi:hypothetical protein
MDPLSVEAVEQQLSSQFMYIVIGWLWKYIPQNGALRQEAWQMECL